MSLVRPFIGFLFLILGLALAQPSFGQTFGEITGVVTDSTGGVVVNATVTVVNPQTNATRTATTNASGNYAFPALLPGTYDVKVEAQGFQAEVRNGVQLQVQQEARLDFQLKVGSLTEAVQVTGGAPLLTTENATVGTVIDNQRIIDLPLNGRNFTALISLSPNVVSGFGTNGAASREGGDRSTVAQIAVGGQRQEWNYYTLDGVSNTDVNYGSYASYLRLTLCRNSRCRRASIQPSLDANPPKSTSPPSVGPTSTMACYSTSFATMTSMPGPLVLLPACRYPHASSGTNSGSPWAARSGFPNCSMARTSCFL